MTFKIEKDVPMPTRTRNGGSKYPFAEMQVNDSFFVEAIGQASERRMYSAIQSYRRRFPEVKMSLRKVDGGLRVWRTE